MCEKQNSNILRLTERIEENQLITDAQIDQRKPLSTNTNIFALLAHSEMMTYGWQDVKIQSLSDFSSGSKSKATYQTM